MTKAQIIALRGLIFESEHAAMVFGHQNHKLTMTAKNYPDMKENSERLQKQYHEAWCVKSKALHKFIDSLLEE